VPEDIILLHGFGGTHRAWDGVVALLDRERYRPTAFDLPGHGDAADAPRPISFAGCVDYVLARSPERFTLCGYSLGGRVALHVALAAPERVRRLVMVSSSPGMEGAAVRAARRRADREFVHELEEGSYEEFIERWRSQPLFVDEPPEVGARAREDQRRNRPDAMAAVLRGLSPGEAPALWDWLSELTMPVVVLVGERDDKYQALGRRMVKRLPRGELLTVPGGHGLPLESPSAVAAVL
jgi:2-succinyl-6-hydroxy-2,4-cyclohexadiene-1-carboxylate synthase